MSWELDKDYEFPLDGESPNFTEFFKNTMEEVGLDQCVWNEEYTKLLERRETLIDMFNHYYYYREIGAETLEKFQHNLQTTLNRIQAKYDYAYKMYVDLPTRAGGGYDEKISREYESAGTTNRSGESQFKDTPISGTINNPTSENSDSSESESTGTGTEEITRIKTDYGESVTKLAKKNIDYYVALDNAFVQEFEEDFMQILMILP